MTTAIFSLALLCTPDASATAESCQMMTVPQLVAQLRPNPVERYLTRELVPIPFEDIATKADFVVEGRVRILKTYLGGDECYLYTDFELVAPVVIWGNRPLPKSPGLQPWVVRQLGGSMVIDDVKVMVEDQQLPPFKADRRVVLLLTRSATDGAYEIAGGPFGAFFIDESENVRPVLRDKGIYDDMQLQTKTEFRERIRKAKGR